MADASGPPGTAVEVDPLAFRRVLGAFATGVVVVAAVQGEGDPIGMSANSFASVSLDPPLVLFCAAHTSTTWPRLRAVGDFSVSVLAAGHEEVCRRFARRGEDRFTNTRWFRGPGGHPVIEGAIAWLDCSLETVHVAGDHDIAVARVRAHSPEPPDSSGPLVFFRGRYGALPAGAP